MRVAVVTPWHRPRNNWLEQCCASVRAQTHACTQIIVADGAAPPPVPGYAGQCIVLQHHHDDWGDTPRSIGALSAAGQGFDAVCWLDDDNWFAPDHVERMVANHRRTGAPVCTSGRWLHEFDGAALGVCPWSNGDALVDANCYFLTRAAFDLIPVWAGMPGRYHCIGDRYFLKALRRSGQRYAHSPHPSVHYRTNWAFIYRHFGKTPPPDARKDARLEQLIEELEAL